MKKFSTYNGLFTRCPTKIIPNIEQNNQEYNQNFDSNKQDNMSNENYSTQNETQNNFADNTFSNQTQSVLQNNADSLKQNEQNFAHYPNSNNDIPSYFKTENFKKNNEKTNKTSTPDNLKENTFATNSADPNEINTLSNKAKNIFKCMQNHDNIMRNIKS